MLADRKRIMRWMISELSAGSSKNIASRTDGMFPGYSREPTMPTLGELQDGSRTQRRFLQWNIGGFLTFLIAFGAERQETVDLMLLGRSFL